MTPRELVRSWVEAFNVGDVDALAALYAEDAVNHQVAESPVVGSGTGSGGAAGTSFRS